MVIIGMILAVFILFLSGFFLGQYGVIVLIIILFGMVLSTFQKNKEIYEDLKMIREKLGLLREDEKIQKENQKNLEKYNNADEGSEVRTRMDEEIEDELEKELEKYLTESEFNKGKKD
ncbi:hypothetical protein M3223_12115 [Paenibacillus pasadenensis]|uniref:hypothetical protein n=1 Tax=Paenibacillus pasadenensis TaxID=217090 RepID=UPI00203FED9B|nr:hypothetical protein [Paenibacillus pasadenensis]MCM3748098.1 hypothetical protein [Paenibacillus pasadenensis]